jgi:hypothetical protein
MDLATAIGYSGTIWLQPGTYTGDLDLTTPGMILRGGGRAILDGDINVSGDGIELWDLELRYSGWPGRVSSEPGDGPSDLPTDKGLSITGPRTRMINCIVHDFSNFGWWGTAVDSEVYGCILYNNGWDAPDRGHGHGVYTQNNVNGRKTLRNCITWGHYATCGKVYSATGAPLRHYDISGLICGPSLDSRFLIGSDDGSTEDVTVQDCMTWGAAMQFTDALATSQIAFDHLYVVHVTDIPFVLAFFASLTGTDNTIVGGNGADESYRVVCKIADRGAWALDDNAYYYTGPNAEPFRDEGVAVYTFAQWQAATGLDANSTIALGVPTANKIVVQPNEYQSGRYHVAIWNWEELASVPAPIAGRYTNAQNMAESVTLAQGAPLPMTGWTTAVPIAAAAPITAFDPRFAVFLVTP